MTGGIVTTGVALIGVGMVSGTYVEALAGRANISVAKVAADPDVGNVVLTPPPNARVDIVRALAAARKPVVCKEPLYGGWMP